MTGPREADARRFNLFGDTYCARALRKVADVGEMAQMELMAYLHDVVGGKGQFTFAFDRFTREPTKLIEKRKRHTCTDATKCVGPRERGRCKLYEVCFRRRPGGKASMNNVRWVGPTPAEWVASLDDAALDRAFQSMERQMLELARLDADLTADWFKLVDAEQRRRSGLAARAA